MFLRSWLGPKYPSGWLKQTYKSNVLTLNKLNCFKEYRIYSHLEFYLGFGSTQVDEINYGPTRHIVSYTANTMPADALVTLWARASASQAYIDPLSQNIPSSASEELTLDTMMWLDQDKEIFQLIVA